MATVCIALGSNIAPDANLHSAADALRARWPDIRFSHVYRTAPMEYASQDAFLNAAAIMETDDTPEAVAEALRGIETDLGKAPAFRFGPRTIDLDLLLYGDRVVSTDALTLPHPRMHSRRFVLEPLLELLPPSGLHPLLQRPWGHLLTNTRDQSCERTDLIL